MVVENDVVIAKANWGMGLKIIMIFYIFIGVLSNTGRSSEPSG